MRSNSIPLYVDVAVIRWQAFTGSQAILEATGQTFTEIKADRTTTDDQPADIEGRR